MLQLSQATLWTEECWDLLIGTKLNQYMWIYIRKTGMTAHTSKIIFICFVFYTEHNVVTLFYQNSLVPG